MITQAAEAGDGDDPGAGQRGDVQSIARVVLEVIQVDQGGRPEVVVGQLQMTDLTGASPDLNNNPTYTRFNPLVGATYKVVPGLTAYAVFAGADFGGGVWDLTAGQTRVEIVP